VKNPYLPPFSPKPPAGETPNLSAEFAERRPEVRGRDATLRTPRATGADHVRPDRTFTIWCRARK
jgi:hypothetical protein